MDKIRIDSRFKFIKRLDKYLKTTKKALKEIRIKSIFVPLVLTFVYWIVRMYMGYFILSSLGLKINFISIIFINGVTMIVSLIPIQTFAGFGIFEGSWAYLLTQLGYNSVEVLPKILTFHIVIVLITIIYGVLGFIFTFILNNKKIYKP